MSKRGLLHIYTGEGKGKTTASIGLAVRAAGMGMKVLFVQFFKEDSAPSGEKDFFRNLAENITLLRANERHPIFTKRKTDEGAVRRSVTETFAEAVKRVSGGGVDLLVLDESISAVNGGWLPMEELIGFLGKRPDGLEVVLTGRDAPVELVKMADYVTEMLKIKHPYDAGIKARKGIEF